MLSKRNFIASVTILIGLATLIGVTYAATDYTWKGEEPGQWDNNGILEDNWFGGDEHDFPVDGDTATQDDAEMAHIQVDSDERCDDFTGDGDSPDDRYLLIESGNELTIDNILQNASETDNYKIEYQAGTGSSDYTKLIVGYDGGAGDITNVDLIPVGISTGWLHVDVADDVTGPEGDEDAAEWTVLENSLVEIDGNVTGVKMTIGSASEGPTQGSTVTLGSIGYPNPVKETWTLLGCTALTVDDEVGTGICFGYETEGAFIQRQHSSKV